MLLPTVASNVLNPSITLYHPLYLLSKKITEMSGVEINESQPIDGWGGPYYVEPTNYSVVTNEMPIEDQGGTWDMEVVGTIQWKTVQK